MKYTSIKNLRAGYGFSLLLLLISSIASFLCIQALLESTRQVNHTNQLIIELESTLSVLKDAETGQRGYLLANDPRFLEPYNNASVKLNAAMASIREHIAGNTVQMENCSMLEKLIDNRLQFLSDVIAKKRAGGIITVQDLEKGKERMDEIRRVMARMNSTEQQMLAARTERMKSFSDFTPSLIIIAAIMAIIITVVSYYRARKDFETRSFLFDELKTKDEEMSDRLTIIDDVASKISNGQYDTRVEVDENNDSLANLAHSLNKMAASLEKSFLELKDSEWLQTGIAQLSDKVINTDRSEQLLDNILTHMVEYTTSNVGALYLYTDQQTLELSATYALSNPGQKLRIAVGQGIAGQVAKTKQPLFISDISETDLLTGYAGGEIKPRYVASIPLLFEGQLKAVIELGSMTPYEKLDTLFLTSISHNAATAINTAQNRRKLQDLLEETQAQSEELQAQHSEMENLNTELEAQAQKLQASEEELRVQQEELLQTNTELEQRGKNLEDMNQMIVERNLEIQRKARELELSTKYKSEFLANMSHELRTPLNSILLLSRLLAENHDTNLVPEQIEYANVINSSGNGLLLLIDEILDLSKIEAGKMNLEFTEFSLDELALTMKSMFLPVAKEKKIEFKTEIAPSMVQSIKTDKLRLEQIIKNLLSNALKFTALGSVQFIVKPAAKDNYISFHVVDTGIGIDKQHTAHIFEAFQQADGSTRRKYGGTGLGLSITRELVKLLGGEISLQSEPNVGSEFTVTIPAYPELIESQPDAEQQETAEVKLPSPVAMPVKQEKRMLATSIPGDIDDDSENIKASDKVILIIEDDAPFAKALLDYTHKQGYKGIVAVRGDQGIEKALQYKPQAILLDLQLPVKDGWEVMEELKSNPNTRHIPVHIMSSMEAKKESIKRGAIDFINKPISLENMGSIFSKIESALNHPSQKVLIIEENPKHAQALAYFLESSNINADVKGSVEAGIEALTKDEVNCVILDMGIPDNNAYETLETVKKTEGLENLPIIIFTGKNLSLTEENKIKQYADSIVMKTAHSYRRILDEVALFLHLVEENEKALPGKSSPQRNILNEVLAGKTVLVVDDDVRNIFSLSKALEHLNMKVISAIDGKDAIRTLEENPNVDIVLMDMMMPEMDGYESTSLIRKNPSFRNLPILAVTAKAMVGDREKCIEAGASDYISKPVDVDQLISLLRVWLYNQTN